MMASAVPINSVVNIGSSGVAVGGMVPGHGHGPQGGGGVVVGSVHQSSIGMGPQMTSNPLVAQHHHPHHHQQQQQQHSISSAGGSVGGSLGHHGQNTAGAVSSRTGGGVTNYMALVSHFMTEGTETVSMSRAGAAGNTPQNPLVSTNPPVMTSSIIPVNANVVPVGIGTTGAVPMEEDDDNDDCSSMTSHELQVLQELDR
jgi:hypothetical protein